MLRSSDFHSDFAGWSLTTHEIGIIGLNLNLSCKAEALSALIKEPHEELFSWKSLEEALLAINLVRENDHAFKVHIKTTLMLSCPCVRCLEPISHEIALNFTIMMMAREELWGPDENPTDCAFDSDIAESNPDEMAIGFFPGHIIDLGLILREQIFLEVPDYPQCKSATAMAQATCKPVDALLSTEASTRENPFVKFWKTN